MRYFNAAKLKINTSLKYRVRYASSCTPNFGPPAGENRNGKIQLCFESKNLIFFPTLHCTHLSAAVNDIGGRDRRGAWVLSYTDVNVAPAKLGK